jgi:predicted enzyme related to lactoylglutathione lyase
LKIQHVTVDCADPYGLATFWSQVMGWPISDIDSPGDDEVLLEPPTPGTPELLFQSVPEPKTVKNRLHFDLCPDERTRDEEVSRLLTMGAALVADHRTPTGRGWVLMADPEGNEFCVEMSVSERG